MWACLEMELFSEARMELPLEVESELSQKIMSEGTVSYG